MTHPDKGDRARSPQHSEPWESTRDRPDVFAKLDRAVNGLLKLKPRSEVVVLSALLLLVSCEPEIPMPSEVEPVVVLDTMQAILPITAVPDSVTASMGQYVGVTFDPEHPVMADCVNGEYVPHEWPVTDCDEFPESDGWLIYETTDTVAKILAGMAPDCGTPTGTNGTISLNSCFGLTVYTRGTGPGITNEGGFNWRVTECVGTSWVSYSLTRYHGSTNIYFPAHRTFSDTARVTISPC